MANVKESKRRKISKLAFTTLNSFSAIILLGFVYFLHNKGLVDSEVITKMSVATMGTVCGICIVMTLSYLKEKTEKNTIQSKEYQLEKSKVRLYNQMKLEHDQELDQIIAALQARKYQQ